MIRIKPLTAAFTGVALATLLLLALMMRLHRCSGGDAAGCGLEKGLNEILAYGLALCVGILALVFLARPRILKLIAFGLLLVITLGTAAAVAFQVI